MKKIVQLFVCLFITVISIHAQKVYFIYLQTDNQQPFYARMGEKIYNSSPSGYLILSSLRDSTYSINIGIQGSQSPDQPYSITVNRKDQGFLVKNFADRGWGLFNLSTMTTIMPVLNPVNAVQTVKTEKREDNAFTNLLAKAADDSTIKEKPIIEKPAEKKVDAVEVNNEKKDEPKNEIKENIPAKQEELKKEVVQEEKKEEPKVDSVAIQKQIEEDRRLAQLKADSIVAAKNKEAELLKLEELRKQDSIDKEKNQIVTEVEYKKSTVKLKSESSTTAVIGLVFVEMQSDNIADKIRILIPPDIKKTTPLETKQEEKKFLDITSSDSAKKDDTKVTVIKSNNCKAFANDDDFFKLRKKMVGESNDNDMLLEASKAFKTKCYSTIQIKNISTIFLTDEFKYKFFDAAYQYVSDTENFASLQSELKDEYYINRFKAMLRF
jgi:hypothetical protein